jgi:hypothetical protein
MTTPREVLEQSGQIPVNGCGYGAKRQIDNILSALAPHLIPEGCVAVCERCFCLPSTAWDGPNFVCPKEPCPIKPIAGYGTGLGYTYHLDECPKMRGSISGCICRDDEHAELTREIDDTLERKGLKP